MDADLGMVYERILSAERPEDAFKELTVLVPPRLLALHLKPEMDSFLAVLDEGRYSSYDDKIAAREAKEKLRVLYDTALTKAGKGYYALDDYSPFTEMRGRTIEIAGVRYAVGEQFHVGEHSKLFRGRMAILKGTAGVVVRIANTPDDNPFLFNEIRMLDLLHRQEVGYWRNVPYMFGRFSAGDRVGIVLRYFAGMTLTEVRANQLHKDGLDQRHVVWIMDRLLGLMWYYHSLGIVHGRIEPDRIRIRRSNHNALLTGWGQAVYRPAVTRERMLPTGSIFEAPEVRDRGEIGPWTDIYCLGKTLIWLIGGNVDTDEMPDTVEPKIRQFLRNMVWKNYKARPHDAQQLYEAQNRLKDSLWPRQFIHLNIA
jgi:serine/threonine protein kinase